MKKYLLLLLIWMIIPCKVEAACTQSALPTSSYNFNLNFKTIDKNDNSFLPNAEYEITTIDNKYKFDVEQVVYEEDEYYSIIGRKDTTADELSEILPNKIKRIYDDINTYEDYIEIENNTRFKHNLESDFCYYWVDNDGNNYNGQSIKLSAIVPLKIKEVKSPIGYQQKELLILVNVDMFFNYRNSDGIVDNKQVIISTVPNSSIFFEYNSSIKYNDYVNDPSSIVDYLESINVEEYNHIIPNEQGTTDLKIDNYIENKYEYKTISNKKISYKIVVNNDGTASSGQYNIKVHIPKELEIDEQSITNNGVFNKENREIIWALDYINPHAEMIYNFAIMVPNNAIGDYSIASILYDNNLNISAPKTILKVDDDLTDESQIKNPNTENKIFRVVLLAITIFGLGAIIYKK